MVSKPYLGRLSWGGLTGTVNFTARGNTVKDIDSVLNLGGLSIEGETDNPYFQKFTIQSITYEKTATRLPNTLWSGKTNMTIPNITITLANATHIVINQLRLTSTTGPGNDASSYNTRSQIMLKSLEMPSGLGLIPSISDVSFAYSFDNLDAEATKNIINYFKTLRTNRSSTNETAKYLALISQVIKPTTTVSQHLDFICSLGAFNNDMKITWALPVTFTDLSDVLKKATIAVNVRMGIPLANKLIAAYFENIDMQDEVPVTESATPRKLMSAAKENFNQTVGLLYQQNKITMPISMQIIGIADQHLSQDAFATNMKSLGLPEDAVAQLQVAYQQYQAQLSKIATIPSPEQAEAQKLAMQRQTQAVMVKNLVDNLVSQGFIKIENNNYVSSILYQSNHITVNGKPFTTDMINPSPVNMGPALPPAPQSQQPLQPVAPQAVQPVPVSSQPMQQPLMPQTVQPLPPQSVRPVTPHPASQPASPQSVQQPPVTQQHLAP